MATLDSQRVRIILHLFLEGIERMDFADGGYELRDKRTQSHVENLIADVPEAAMHRAALRQLKSDFSYAKKQQDGSWISLIHFSAGIQKMFGFTRDIALVYLKHFDLQPRAVQPPSTIQAALPNDRKCEDHLYLISSRDLNAAIKLERWSKESRFLTIAMPHSVDEKQQADQIIFNLTDKLAMRN